MTIREEVANAQQCLSLLQIIASLKNPSIHTYDRRYLNFEAETYSFSIDADSETMEVRNIFDGYDLTIDLGAFGYIFHKDAYSIVSGWKPSIAEKFETLFEENH